MTNPSADDLRNHPVLGALDQYNLERLLQMGRIEQGRRNDEIYSIGDRAERVLLVADGAIKITSVAGSQREVILDILGPGDLAGDEALTEDRRSTAAVIMRDARLLTFPASAVRTQWSRNPDFAAAWMRYVNSQRLRIQERITELAYGNIEDRLFRMLVHLSQHHGSRTKKGNIVIQFALTHHELANLIGATRETTTLAVGRLKSEGLISFMDRKIVLKERSRMEAGQEEKAG